MNPLSTFGRTLILLLIFLPGCRQPVSPLPEIDGRSFAGYWYQGKAEITSFRVRETIEGNTYAGAAQWIFVMEDLHKDKGIKLRDPKRHASDAVKVMRSNWHQEFRTGISSYVMMTSVYTPEDDVSFPQSLKMTSGMQDWSGQTFLQANWKGHRYEVHRYSGLESEGDSTYTLVNTWLEDELWNKIRVSPNALPLGEINIVPAAFFLRLYHVPMKSFTAQAELREASGQYRYILSYPKLKRVLEIYFEKDFPHKIVGWKQVLRDKTITIAEADQTIQSDYWNHMLPGDSLEQKQLLPPAGIKQQ